MEHEALTPLKRALQLVDPQKAADAVLMWLPNLLIAVVTAMAFYALYRVAKKGLGFVLQRAQMDPTATQFMQTLLSYAVGAVTIITVLGQLGVNVTSVVASLGVAGLTLGLAAQDALSNIIAGLFIFWDRPFVIGDLVEIGGHYGRVEVITMRSTRVITPDGKMLAIPNATIVNATVASYTNFPHLRLDIEVTVGVNEDLDRVRGLFLELVADRPELLQTPAPDMRVSSLNDYNLGLTFTAWLADEKTHVVERARLREAIYVCFRQAGVDMPNETISLTPLEVRQAAGGAA